MGKGTIHSNLGDGRYILTVNYDLRRKDRNLKRLNDRKDAIVNNLIPKATQDGLDAKAEFQKANDALKLAIQTYRANCT